MLHGNDKVDHNCQVILIVIAYSHCMGQGLGQVQRKGKGLMGPNIFYSNVHTNPRQEPDPLSPIVPVPFPVPVPVPVKRFQNPLLPSMALGHTNSETRPPPPVYKIKHA